MKAVASWILLPAASLGALLHGPGAWSWVLVCLASGWAAQCVWGRGWIAASMLAAAGPLQTAPFLLVLPGALVGASALLAARVKEGIRWPGTMAGPAAGAAAVAATLPATPAGALACLWAVLTPLIPRPAAPGRDRLEAWNRAAVAATAGLVLVGVATPGWRDAWFVAAWAALIGVHLLALGMASRSGEALPWGLSLTMFGWLLGIAVSVVVPGVPSAPLLAAGLVLASIQAPVLAGTTGHPAAAWIATAAAVGIGWGAAV